MRKSLVAVAAVAVLVGVGGGTAAASGAGGDWTQADHDASGNRANTTATQITAANAGTVAWVRGFTAPAFKPGSPGTCAEGWTTPVLAGKKAYAVATGRLTALDLTTGAQLWQRAIDTTGVSASTVYAVDGGRVFVGQLSCLSASDPIGSIRVYDAATGAPLWTHPVDGLSGIAVSGTRVLAAGSSEGSGDSTFVFDVATGAVAWQRPNADFCGVSSRIVLNQVYYLECSGTTVSLVAARLADGTVAWRKVSNVGVDRGDRPGADATHLFGTGVTAPSVVALNPATGAVRYTATGLNLVDAVGTNRVFGRCNVAPGTAGTVCAVDKQTGARSWTSTIAGPLGADTGTTASAATLLYLPTGQVLNSTTGAVVTTLWTGQDSALSVGNGYVLTVPQTTPRVLDVYGLPGS